jgi:hypothetical protein
VIPKESGWLFRFIPAVHSEANRLLVAFDSGKESERSDAGRRVIIKAPNSSQSKNVQIKGAL